MTYDSRPITKKEYLFLVCRLVKLYVQCTCEIIYAYTYYRYMQRGTDRLSLSIDYRGGKEQQEAEFHLHKLHHFVHLLTEHLAIVYHHYPVEKRLYRRTHLYTQSTAPWLLN